MDETERLNDLIARCEKASGPDRGLDVDIWTAVAPDDAAMSLKLAVRDVRDCNPVLVLRDRAPKFTGSFDAAMTLVSEGWIWGVAMHAPDEVFNMISRARAVLKDPAIKKAIPR